MSQMPNLDRVIRRAPTAADYLPHISVGCLECGGQPGEPCIRNDSPPKWALDEQGNLKPGTPWRPISSFALQLLGIPHLSRVRAWEASGRPPAAQRQLLSPPARPSHHEPSEWD